MLSNTCYTVCHNVHPSVDLWPDSTFKSPGCQCQFHARSLSKLHQSQVHIVLCAYVHAVIKPAVLFVIYSVPPSEDLWPASTFRNLDCQCQSQSPQQKLVTLMQLTSRCQWMQASGKNTSHTANPALYDAMADSGVQFPGFPVGHCFPCSHVCNHFYQWHAAALERLSDVVPRLYVCTRQSTSEIIPSLHRLQSHIYMRCFRGAWSTLIHGQL